MKEISQELIDQLRISEKVVVLTGAGISKESGIPTFREAQTGLWASYDPKELATPEAFQRNPELVWEWYEWRRALIAHSQPNNGHKALMIMEKCVPDFLLITQNVDGMHQRAGNMKVIELHGNIHRNICYSEGIVIDQYKDSDENLPRCPRCGDYIRPDVVWFGEQMPEEELGKAYEAVKSADFFFSIGTSGIVQPAAALPYVALEAGAIIVEMNTEETGLTKSADYFIQGMAGKILPRLVKITWNEVIP